MTQYIVSTIPIPNYIKIKNKSNCISRGASNYIKRASCTYPESLSVYPPLDVNLNLELYINFPLPCLGFSKMQEKGSMDELFKQLPFPVEGRDSGGQSTNVPTIAPSPSKHRTFKAELGINFI